MKLSSNVVGDSNDENNFPHKLLLTNTQSSKLRKDFENGSSGNINLSKTQLYKIGQSGGFLGRLLGPLLKTGLPLIENVLKPSAKSVLIPMFDIMFGSGTTTSIISDKEMNDIIKAVISLEESGLLIEDVSQTIKNEAKEQKEGFLGM